MIDAWKELYRDDKKTESVLRRWLKISQVACSGFSLGKEVTLT